jgi:glycosyltransferase involved in cell wall biosynthesis
MLGERSGKIAYIMSRFPHLPETFILREMVEMERQGWRVSLYPLILQNQEVVHPEATGWLQRAETAGLVSKQVVSANFGTLRRQPRRLLGTAARAFAENASSPNFLARAALLLPKAVYIARKMQADGVTHVHAHYATHPALVAWIIHRLTGIPYSITVHAHDIFVRREMLEAKLRAASFIVAISRFNRDYLAELYGGWITAKTHIVHCGIEPEKYQARPMSPGGSKQLEIINVGSLQPYKGQIYLIWACALLRERGIPYRCRIVGGGEEEPRLKKEIQRLNLEDWVELLGPQTQEKVAELLASAGCYVQPSIITPSGKMEGLPVAIMEALTCRLPVVATAISGVPELVQNEKTGYLVPQADPERLAEGLMAVWSDPQKAALLAAEGRKLVLQEFDLRQNVSQLAALFYQYSGVRPAAEPEIGRAAPLVLID